MRMRRPRPLGRHGLRRMMWASLASALWANRRDVARWAGFARRAVLERDRRPLSDLLTEAKVRAAVTSDPLLRRDPALSDLRVDDGVVTLLTSTPGWPDPRDEVVRLTRVKGITDITTRLDPGGEQGGRPTGRSTASSTGASGAAAAHTSTTVVAGAPYAASTSGRR